MINVPQESSYMRLHLSMGQCCCHLIALAVHTQAREMVLVAPCVLSFLIVAPLRKHGSYPGNILAGFVAIVIVLCSVHIMAVVSAPDLLKSPSHALPKYSTKYRLISQGLSSIVNSSGDLQIIINVWPMTGEIIFLFCRMVSTGSRKRVIAASSIGRTPLRSPNGGDCNLSIKVAISCSRSMALSKNFWMVSYTRARGEPACGFPNLKCPIEAGYISPVFTKRVRAISQSGPRPTRLKSGGKASGGKLSNTSITFSMARSCCPDGAC